jgi:hypothetical protein
VKNRMREICTSGSVRGGGGNVPTYSALLLAERRQVTEEGTSVAQAIAVLVPVTTAPPTPGSPACA